SERISALKGAGLAEINFSTGDEHARFVPMERVAIASAAAVREGYLAHIMLIDAIRDLPPELQSCISINESPWMPLDPWRVASYPPEAAINKTSLGSCAGCDSVLETYVVQPDGRIGAC